MDPHEIGLRGEHPIAFGAFADIWEATYDGRKVAVKLYRRYESFDLAQVLTVRCDHLANCAVGDLLPRGTATKSKHAVSFPPSMRSS